MQIQMWPVERVTPYDKNPRINDPAINAVAKSLQEFGWRQPIVVDHEGVIVVGHTRYKAALKLGYTEVPVHVATGLSPAQIKAYRLADNQTATIAEWNLELLPLELNDLKAMDFNIDLLGFGTDELAKILGTQVQDGECDPDEVPLPPDEPVTQPGDLWVLGDHRLLCGDSAKPDDVDRLLDGAVIHLINSDPPYNVKVEPRSHNAIAAGLSSFQGATHQQSLDLERHPGKSKPTQKKLRAKDRPLANDFVTDEQFDRLLGRLVRQLRPRAAARPGILHLGRLCQPGQLSAVPEKAWPLLLTGHRLGQAASGADEEGFSRLL